MKLRRLFALLFGITLSFTSTINAQLFEDFESGDGKASYAGASVSDLASGSWYLEDALIGNLSNDKFNGNRGVRMDRRNGRTGNIYMQFDHEDGADEVSFYLAHYGNNAEEAALQVQYSTDGGSNWINIGDEIEAPFELTEFSIPVQIEGNIRFKFIQSGGTDRLNIDDIRITNYIAPTDSATLSIQVDEMVVDSGAVLDFGSVLIGSTSNKTIQLKNVGATPLTISNIVNSDAEFYTSQLSDSILDFNETVEITLTFEPSDAGEWTGTTSILSDAQNSQFALSLLGEGLSADATIPIANARDLPEGSIVTIAGIVTVAEEFEGPMYFQDNSGGIAWFFSEMRDNTNSFFSNVSRGDSILITGELGSFNELIQIVGDDPQFQFKPNQVSLQPRQLTVAEMNSGDFEGQLIALEVEIDHSGALQGNTNYEISDASGTGELRISSFTDIVGSTAPSGVSTIVGVVSNFRGTYQLQPRDLNDIDAEINVIPGEDVPKDQTFEIVTWNIEWFGQAGSGPEDDDLQLMNVITVIDSIDADIYAFQEISDAGYFNALDDSLTEYEGILATYSQDQKTAYMYKTETVELLNSGLISSGMTSSDWAAGRFPFLLHADVTINDEEQEFFIYNIHAKAFAEQSDYNQRINASTQLKAYLDGTHQGENVIVLGDFNDEILQSNFQGIESPYKNFDDDVNYTIITKSLEENGFTSFGGTSMIDHILMNSALQDEYFVGTERVENPSYIGSYLSQTSDHYPVWVRFQWGTPVSNEEVSAPSEFELSQNYPNPFNPTTQIEYSLQTSSLVSLEVYDMMGRKVATLVEPSYQIAGKYSYTFDASNLASGAYFYRLSTDANVFTRKMLLIK